MTPTLSRLSAVGRAAIVALTLGAATITAMPAQAAPSFSIEFGVGDRADGPSFRNDRHRNNRHNRSCLTNRQVERGLRHYGYRDAHVVKNLNRSRVLVVAEKGRRDYSMKVNKCTGTVYDVERLRRGGRNVRPGFGFQFNFGN